MTSNKSSFDDSLAVYRLKTFNTAPGKRVATLQAAVEFVNRRGFVTFWPIKNVDLPSLWTAVAGDRAVADEHDDPGHVTWGWKDQMLDQKIWYYGKLLRGKATMVSLDIIRYFYALSPRVADLDDFRLEYEAGRLTRPAVDVAEVLLVNGPTHSIELRQLARLNGKASKYSFERALVELQKGLWILPVGVAEAGGWRYSFIYELFDRWYPQVWETARKIKISQARAKLVELYLQSVGAADAIRIQRLFGWGKDETSTCLEELLKTKAVGKLGDGRWITRSLIAESQAV